MKIFFKKALNASTLLLYFLIIKKILLSSKT